MCPGLWPGLAFAMSASHTCVSDRVSALCPTRPQGCVTARVCPVGVLGAVLGPYHVIRLQHGAVCCVTGLASTVDGSARRTRVRCADFVRPVMTHRAAFQSSLVRATIRWRLLSRLACVRLPCRGLLRGLRYVSMGQPCSAASCLACRGCCGCPRSWTAECPVLSQPHGWVRSGSPCCLSLAGCSIAHAMGSQQCLPPPLGTVAQLRAVLLKTNRHARKGVSVVLLKVQHWHFKRCGKPTSDTYVSACGLAAVSWGVWCRSLGSLEVGYVDVTVTSSEVIGSLFGGGPDGMAS